jgi:ribokinase
VTGEVVVVGAINVDLVVAAPHLPGPGETVVGPGVERHGGGKGANAAVAAARAGASVRLVGAVGADEHGTGALEELRAEGIDVGAVAVLETEPTGVALIVVDPAGENQIAVGAGANAAVSAESVVAALRDALPIAGCVLVSTEIPNDAVTAAVTAATSAGVRCVLNPAPVIPAVLEALAHGPLLTPNETEIVDLAVALGDGGAPSVIDAARAVAARTHAPVVVTLGGDGALVVTPDGNEDHVPARAATVRDTTGAGDTFNGVLAARLAAGDALDAAARIATAAASLSVAHVGARAGMPDAAAIEAAL